MSCTGFHIGFFEKGGGGGGGCGGNHLTPPTYQETVPITNALTPRIRLWKKNEQLHTFFAATVVILLVFML